VKALTLQRPWPWAITCLGKRIENRTWFPPESLIGQRIAIHAGKAFDDDGADWITDTFNAYVPPEPEHPTGIIATALLAGVVTESNSPWFVGPNGWLLQEVEVLPEPIPARGEQGLWDWTPPTQPDVAAHQEPQPLVPPTEPSVYDLAQEAYLHYASQAQVPVQVWKRRCRKAIEQARLTFPPERREKALRHYFERYCQGAEARVLMVHAIALFVWARTSRRPGFGECLETACQVVAFPIRYLPERPLPTTAPTFQAPLFEPVQEPLLTK
jgi:hypothetical protein